MITCLKRCWKCLSGFISDLFYAQYIASFSEAGDFKEAKRLAEERYGKSKAKAAE